jgi:hypothetical protein
MSDPRFSFLDHVTTGGEEVEQLIRGTAIRIVTGKDATGTFAGQVLLYQLATQLARLFDRVELEGDGRFHSRPELPGLDGPFLPALRALLPTLRPLDPSAPVTNSITVSVGRSDETSQINLGASGWSAHFSLRDTQPVADSPNPLGALAAGTLGAAEIFKVVFEPYLRNVYRPTGYSLSLLDYGPGGTAEPDLPDRIDLDATLFGCGSIGCGLVLGVLATPRLHGSLTVVDNGRFDEGNPYKYALLDWTTAEDKLAKASWAAQSLNDLAGERITARGFVGTAESYVASLPEDYQLPLAVSAVDTVLARWQIQDALPGQIVNAGITGTTVEVSVHGFGEGPCLACVGLQTEIESWDAKPIADATGLPPTRVYELIRGNEPLTVDDLSVLRTASRLPADTMSRIEVYQGQPLLSLWNRVAYSQAAVQVGSAPPVQVTTAFVSAFASVLLLTELIKAAVPALRDYAVTNSYRQDLLGAPAQALHAYERDPRGWCLCHSSFRLAVYRKKYGRAA